VRSAETELKNTKELHATASEIAAPKPDLGAKAKKNTILKHFLLERNGHFIYPYFHLDSTSPYGSSH
jgi:hypothetical protein